MEPDEARFTTKVLLAREMGWTLDYIDGLPQLKLLFISEVLSASNAADVHIAKRGIK